MHLINRCCHQWIITRRAEFGKHCAAVCPINVQCLSWCYPIRRPGSNIRPVQLPSTLQTKPRKKTEMVWAVGFEPTFSGISKFSLLLIFAFLCANLPAKIQAFSSHFKHYLASLGNNVKKNACRGVSPILSVSMCVAIKGGRFLCRFVSLSSLWLAGRKARQRAIVRDWRGSWQVWSRSAGDRTDQIAFFSGLGVSTPPTGGGEIAPGGLHYKCPCQ